MKKVIRLTESDLIRVVKRVLREQSSLMSSDDFKPKSKPIIADTELVNRIFKDILNSSGRFNSNYTKLTRSLNSLKPENTTITNDNPDNPQNELLQAKKNYQYLITLIKQPKLTGAKFPLDNLEHLISVKNSGIGPVQSSDYKKIVNLAIQIDNKLK
jgi:hypothetical protein